MVDSVTLSRRAFIAAGASATAFALTNPATANQTSPFEMSIIEAGGRIRSGELSPVDLVESYLARIQKLDPLLNSFITLNAEIALRHARERESELIEGSWRGPLHGIPIALKDNIDTAGIRTTAASAVFLDRVPNKDAEVVRRLKDAGAIILGKLNMHEFAFGASSAVSHFGPVHNPWDLDRIPGGSSGGSGAAVAANLCAGALGTDTGGSIRTPAALCGIVGLKPTYGLVSIRGIIPLSVTADHVGPMCRTVGDTAVMLQVMAGYDPLDIASREANIPNYKSALKRKVADLRLGIPRALFFEDVEPEILAAVETAISLLGELTASTEDVALPPLPQSSTAFVESYEYHQDLMKEKAALYGSLTRDRILRGANISATDYAALLYDVQLARKAIAGVFEKVDLLITPTVPRLPVLIDEALASPPASFLIRNNIPFNVFGIPSISLPCGYSQGGLPIGLQISGPALGELNVFALAHAYEQATDWHKMRPPLA